MSAANIGNILLDKEILLESGTNELEMLVFTVADYMFGINVAKVREVLPQPEITNLPKAHDSIRGVFKLREAVIPCVSLLDYFGIGSDHKDAEGTLILADFNRQQTGFLVDGVEKIHRMSWENILAVPPLMALAQTPVTAVARVDERLIVMLDFEMIIDKVTDSFFRTDRVENPMGLPREELKVLLADDSPTVRQAVGQTLRTSGYTDLNIFQNGSEVWEWIAARYEETGRVEDVADLLISDVEMPLVDGFHLTKRVKQHPELSKLPVLLYSSIITPDNQKKGAAVGADAQVAKPELDRVVQLADELISQAKSLTGETLECKPEATQPQTDAVAPTPAEPTPGPATPVGSETPEPVPVEVPSQAVPTTPPVPSTSQPNTPRNPALWETFRVELSELLRSLKQYSWQITQNPGQEEPINAAFRTLHTIKSAAMVVPVDEVAHTTHAVESLLEGVRDRNEMWPAQPIESYLEWLERLTPRTADIPKVLRAVGDLEAELTGALAAHTG